MLLFKIFDTDMIWFTRRQQDFIEIQVEDSKSFMSVETLICVLLTFNNNTIPTNDDQTTILLILLLLTWKPFACDQRRADTCSCVKATCRSRGG